MDEHAQTLAAMAARRVESLKHRLRRDIAIRILEDSGSVTAEQVAARFAAEWVEPTDRQLADQMAAKARAAVEYAQRQVRAADDAVAGAEAKTAKFAALHEQAVAEMAEALARPDAARADLAAAEALAAYAEASGDPSQAPAPSAANASARIATGRGDA